MSYNLENYICRFNIYLKQWFNTNNRLVNKNLRLKEEHTERVRENTIELSNLLQLSKGQKFLAELIALFHDIARFKQFYYYKTFDDKKSFDHAEEGVKIIFDDKKSFDHAEEGVKIIKENGFLNGISGDDQNRVISSIKNHNKKTLPIIKDDTEKLLASLIRDADKLDIWRIVGDELAKKDEPSITLGYTGNNKFNPEIVKLIKNEESVDYKLVRSTLDFKLVTLGWIYDINFRETFLLIRKNKVLDPILNSLPEIPEVISIKKTVEDYINNGLD